MDEKQAALEIIGLAIDNLMPDFRATGNAVEHATAVAEELKRRFSTTVDVTIASSPREGEYVNSRLAVDIFRLKWSELHPLARAAFAHHMFELCGAEMAKHIKRSRDQKSVLSVRRKRVNEAIYKADEITAALFLHLMHEADAEADKLIPHSDITTDFKQAF